MSKTYNIFIIARLYLKNYYKFLITNTDITDSEEAISLFMYGMKKIYGLDTVEFNASIGKYGAECIKALTKTKNTPKKKDIKDISFEDRVRIVSVGEGYAKVIGLLTTEAIKNSRIRED